MNCRPDADSLTIDLAEDDIDGPNDSNGIRQHMSPGHGVDCLQVSKAGTTDLAAVRPVCSVRDHEYAELALG